VDVSFDQPLSETLERKALWLLIVSLMLAMFVSGLNQSLVATATPKMLADLGGFGLLSWVFTIYLLSSTVVAPLVGKLSDMYGRKLFLLSGLMIFVVASTGCGAAVNMPMLVFFRGLQGLGGGMIMACVMASLGDLFSPAERGKYMGFFTGAMAIAGLSGPSIGGLVTDLISWRATFYVNVPVVMLAAGFIWFNLPTRKRGGRLREIDFFGSVLLSAGTVLLLLALTWAQKHYGWGSQETIGMLAASAVFILLFARQEMRHPNAILPPMLFKNREFAFASLMVVLFGAASMGASQYLPTFVQTSLSASATTSGLVTTPQSIGMLITSVIGGQMVARRGKYKGQIIAGTGIAFIGTLFLQHVGVGQPTWHISLYMVLMGFGSGLVMPTVSVVSQNAVAQQYMGVASGARQFFMQIGSVLGVTIFGVVLANSYSSTFNAELGPQTEAAVPAGLLARFDDPTLALNQRQFGGVQAELRQLDNGEALLNELVAAQREGVASAMRHIYLGASVLMVLAMLTAFGLKGLPLRRSSTAVAVPAGQTRGTSPPPGGEPIPTPTAGAIAEGAMHGRAAPGA
jgi:EmrB/QacA subfamily drug resistance transporter